MRRVTYAPNDSVSGFTPLEMNTVVDFWRWAFGDLCDDDVKGIYAEWLVHKLLGIQTSRRVSWANSDIITPSGTRVEVKSSAYCQSWKFLDERGELEGNPRHAPKTDDKSIRFSGLMAGDSIATHGKVAANFKSDFYVFALQCEKDFTKWNALDLNQWEFFLVPAHVLKKLGSKSISLATLRAKFETLTAEELAIRGRTAIEAHESAAKVR